MNEKMARRHKKTRSSYGMQVVTLCISTTLVLVLLGMVVLSVQTARNLSAYVKENLTVTVMLSDELSPAQAHGFCRTLYSKPYTLHVDYISKEQAKKEQTKAMGADPSEFLGFNPFVATVELKLKADYVNSEWLKAISREMKKHPYVTDVAYQEDLMDKVNANLQKVNMVLLVLAVLLTCVSFSLINNTVRLNVYSRRFSIHTMKLVGASWGFIRRPFLGSAFWVGVLAALLACALLAGGIYALYDYEPGVLLVITWQELAVTGGAVFLFGILITMLCTFFSVNKFLRMSAGQLYKI